MNYHLVLLFLSIAGMAETLYLLRKHVVHQNPVCIIGDQCHTVWESTYSKTFGVSNDILGMVFYALVGVLELMIVGKMYVGTLFMQAEAMLVVAGFCMSGYFFYLQWRIIRAWCFWCVLSGMTTLLMAAVLFFGHG
ncbi:MAG: vitamin K epoxide reductase family protein [Minisyncoccota bacterium]